MKLRSVLFLLALGLVGLDWSLALPIEIVDLERMKSSLVDVSKVGEIVNEKETDGDDVSNGKFNRKVQLRSNLDNPSTA